MWTGHYKALSFLMRPSGSSSLTSPFAVKPKQSLIKQGYSRQCGGCVADCGNNINKPYQAREPAIHDINMKTFTTRYQ